MNAAAQRQIDPALSAPDGLVPDGLVPDGVVRDAGAPAALLTPMNCVCFGLNRAARATTRRYDAALKPAGLTSGQFGLIATLSKAGALPLSRLATILGLDRTTLNRNLRLLEDAGLVTTGAGGDDARIRPIHLTPAGEAKMAEALPLWRAAQEVSVRRVGAEAWPALRAELDRLA